MNIARENGGQAPAYVHNFPDWLAEKIMQHDISALLNYRQQAPDAVRAHPSDEHLQPLYVALGAAGNAPRIERLHTGVSDYVLAMDEANRIALRKLCPTQYRERIKLFLDFAPEAVRREVPDPYYGGAKGFEEVLDLVESAARGLLEHIRTARP
jgi:protein-tyrosine-phosphatase